MILEKIKEHGGKIMFFAMNILLVAVGTLFLKQKNTEILNVATSEADAQNLKMATDYALYAQSRIIAENEAKIKSIANNSGTITTQNPDSKVQAPSVENPKTPQSVNVPKTVIPVIPPIAVALTKTNGKCGSADSSAKRSNSNCKGKAPSLNLCSAGSVSSIAFKPNKYDTGWNWTCSGSNGGASATCRCS